MALTRRKNTRTLEDPCFQCGGPGPLVCSRCKAARYCGKVCQTAHWKSSHKRSCLAPEDKAKNINQPSDNPGDEETSVEPVYEEAAANEEKVDEEEAALAAEVLRGPEADL